MYTYIYIYTHTYTHSHTYIHTFICHTFQLSIDGHLGCFHVLAIVHTASLNIGIHVSFQISVSVFWEYTLRSGIAGSYGSYCSP